MQVQCFLLTTTHPSQTALWFFPDKEECKRYSCCSWTFLEQQDLSELLYIPKLLIILWAWPLVLIHLLLTTRLILGPASFFVFQSWLSASWTRNKVVFEVLKKHKGLSRNLYMWLRGVKIRVFVGHINSIWKSLGADSDYSRTSVPAGSLSAGSFIHCLKILNKNPTIGYNGKMFFF